jgi:hypothetical protein
LQQFLDMLEMSEKIWIISVARSSGTGL